MGQKSTRENKNYYQICREEAELTVQEACDKMPGMGKDRITRIENGSKEAEAIDVLMMASAYNKPELCNYHCSHTCEIGKLYVPEVKTKELPPIVLGMVASLNEMNESINKLIAISEDGAISNDEMHDFAVICKKLDKISLTIDSLNLWKEKMINNNELDGELLLKEMKKLDK